MRTFVLATVILVVSVGLVGCAATTAGKWDKENQNTEPYECIVSGDVTSTMSQLTMMLMTDNWGVANSDTELGILVTEPKSLTEDETVKQSTMFDAFSASMVGQTYSYDRGRLNFFITAVSDAGRTCSRILMKPVLLFRTTTQGTLFTSETAEEEESDCPQGYPLAQKWIDKLATLAPCEDSAAEPNKRLQLSPAPPDSVAEAQTEGEVQVEDEVQAEEE